ncbi:MAG: response regulator transcription factor [Candidatus Obscuribacterales bacterium]|nr:response regulator transcription factor [Candidatus Obscuribacterales bacterium]
MAKILVVEDDVDLSSKVSEWLSFEQHLVEVVYDGQEAYDRLRVYSYECVILDWDLPKMTGLEVCKQFRNHGGHTPILMLTGKDAIAEKEAGLDAGADDYLTKPFHLKELSARIRALLRRPVQSYTGGTIKTGELELDPLSRRVTRNGSEIILQPKEYALLEFFMRHPNEVFSPDALINRVWNSESDTSADTIYTYMKVLRRKISPEAPGSLIKTVHGVGYKLESK